MRRKLAAYAIGELLPGTPELNAGKTYAAWRVWSGSTTEQGSYAPLPKKQAARLWHKARRFDRQTHQHRKHGGAVGRTALAVLHALLFEFLDYRTGRLDPSYDGLARRAGVCRRAVASALRRLKALGILNWLRRCSEGRDAQGRFMLSQETNAYAILPSSQWRGFHEPPEPDVHPSEWGAVPPLPAMMEQARAALREGDSVTSVRTWLKDDPDDRLACDLAALFEAVAARQSKLLLGCI